MWCSPHSSPTIFHPHPPSWGLNLLPAQLLGSLFTLSPGELYHKTCVKQLRDFVERTGRNFVSQFRLDAFGSLFWKRFIHFRARRGKIVWKKLLRYHSRVEFFFCSLLQRQNPPRCLGEHHLKTQEKVAFAISLKSSNLLLRLPPCCIHPGPKGNVSKAKLPAQGLVRGTLSAYNYGRGIHFFAITRRREQYLKGCKMHRLTSQIKISVLESPGATFFGSAGYLRICG